MLHVLAARGWNAIYRASRIAVNAAKHLDAGKDVLVFTQRLWPGELCGGIDCGVRIGVRMVLVLGTDYRTAAQRSGPPSAGAVLRSTVHSIY